MALHVDLTSDLENFVDCMLPSVRYAVPTNWCAMPFAACGLRKAAWQAAVQIGDDGLDWDQGLAYSPELLGQITASASNAISSGLAVNPYEIPGRVGLHGQGAEFEEGKGLEGQSCQ